MNFTEDDVKELFRTSVSKSEVARKLGKPRNGTGLKIVDNLIKKYNINIDHFSFKGAIEKFNRIYEVIEKTCPVCGKLFTDKKDHKRQKVTCSHSCSNTYFRSGKNHPNWKEDVSEWGYRKICFSKWKKECAICGFDKVVDVHHLDHDNSNNDINNLIPLCPNHHMMLHTKKYNAEVVEQISKITGISS